MRAQIVDAAFRAIDRLGPDVSIREIAEEAGTAKPKIYRHFNDKSDLFQAIGRRLRDMLWTAIFPGLDFANDPTREVIRRSVGEYVNLVDQHPNVVRFMLQGRFPGQSGSTVQALNEGREITLAMAALFNNELREMELNPAAFELAASATFGLAASATDWWLGPDPDSPRQMGSDEFVTHLTTLMLGAVQGTAEVLSVQLDPDKPIRTATPRQAAVGGVT